jgi:hypothetical protein
VTIYTLEGRLREAWDRDGFRWLRYEDGWSFDGSGDPMPWSQLVGSHGPMGDGPPSTLNSRPDTTITPEIRSQALGHAIAAHRAIVENLTDNQLAVWSSLNPKNLYQAADAYAAYIATGEHPK